MENEQSEMENVLQEKERKNQVLQTKTKDFALAVLRFVETLPKGRSIDILVRQIVRSATSVGANYRAACRARSKAEFISKLSIVHEESDECEYWLELIYEMRYGDKDTVKNLLADASSITAMVVASLKTAKQQSI